jgi:protein-tyrosine phosphatase
MSFFKKLFASAPKEPEMEPMDMSAVAADMHSHLIPGIDDGAKDMEDAIHLIENLVAFGYKHIITTPHIYKELYPNTAAIIIEGREKVRQELQRRNIQVQFDAAAEYFLDEHFMELLEKKELLTWGNNHVLYELSFDSEPYYFKTATFQLQLAGYQPVLAHPERYLYWHERFSNYENVVDKDVMLQLNINSLSGQYGPMVKKMSERLIDAGLISFLGTDTHHQGHVNLWNTVKRNSHLKKLIDSGNLKNADLLVY